MKALVVGQDIGGPASKLMEIRDARKDALDKKPLGHVMGELTKSIIRPDAAPTDEIDEEPPQDITEPHFQFQVSIAPVGDGYDEILKRLRDLLALRNELVHHFLEGHDIWSEEGCVEAQTYLDASYEQVDARYRELEQLAKTSMEARAFLASFIQTPEYQDFAFHGILPDGAGVDWSVATIVKLLRQAEASLSQGGWTPLNAAIASIQATHPEHTPRRYGCSSWRQVLHESRQFQVRKEMRNAGQPTKIAYRSIPEQ